MSIRFRRKTGPGRRPPARAVRRRRPVVLQRARVSLAARGLQRGGGCRDTTVQVYNQHGTRVALLRPPRWVRWGNCGQGSANLTVDVGTIFWFRAFYRILGPIAVRGASKPVGPECESPTGYYLPERYIACVEWGRTDQEAPRTWWEHHPCKGA